MAASNSCLKVDPSIDCGVIEALFRAGCTYTNFIIGIIYLHFIDYSLFCSQIAFDKTHNEQDLREQLSQNGHITAL